MMIMESLMLNGKGLVAMLWTGWVGCLLWLVGGFDLLVVSLGVLMIMDYATGVMVGYKKQILNSKRAWVGLQKKMMIWVIVCGATIISYIFKNDIARNTACTFYIATEFLSIIENGAILGVPIPKKLKATLEQVTKGE